MAPKMPSCKEVVANPGLWVKIQRELRSLRLQITNKDMIIEDLQDRMYGLKDE
ncbi:hypothetical protein LCGC14_0298230 [marine sediment metagenome]|uniref:Uncharacterized protein n=1 Tax=marine sediment metagenome TaxID=412755 RepID=A0A0F9WX44_9ZZZZ